MPPAALPPLGRHQGAECLLLGPGHDAPSRNMRVCQEGGIKYFYFYSFF